MRMLIIEVLVVKAHPAQKFDRWHRNSWAAKVRVSLGRKSKTFWRWVHAKSEEQPSIEAVQREVLEDAFHGIHGFDDDAPEARA